MPDFFSKYPKIDYDLLSDGSIFRLTDISRAAIINSNKIQDDSVLYTYYDIVDGERPDIVSHKLYGDSSFYWTFFIINDFLRDGYYSSWPLSYNDFTKMIEREYNNYSAISCIPVVLADEQLNGTGKIDVSCIPLDSQYLPYLKFESYNGEYKSTLVRYDARRHQFIISDIFKFDKAGNKIYTTREDFIENESITYRIVWDDSVLDTTLSQTEALSKNITLKTEWIDKIYSNIAPLDPIGYKEHIESNISSKQYVTNKSLLVANAQLRWSDYANASHEYYSNSGEILSAYDVLSNENTLAPKYQSFYEYETQNNDSKRSIKIIRQDFINDFSEKYFDILNNII
jgi:hypothetical protein